MSWKAGGVSLPHGPYMIGAGVCKTPVATEKWLQVEPVVSGSYTSEQRYGNEGLVMCPDTLDELLEYGFGLNSYGMPNISYGVAAVALTAMEHEQPLIVSLAGFSPYEYVRGVELLARVNNLSAIELNFGCPNTQGEHKMIMSFDFDTVWEIMVGVARLELSMPIWIKLSPYSNPSDLQRMAEILNHCVGAHPLAVVTCNTFPNAYAGKGKIDPNDGLAGLSGPAMKPIALGQVRQFRQQLNASIDVIGVGGITTGDDIVDFLDAGASAVQITSLAHWAGDPRSFQERLFKEETASRFFKLMEAN